MDETAFEDLLQAPAPEPTPLDNYKDGDTNEPMAADDGEDPEVAPTGEDNESVANDKNMPDVP